MNLFYRGRGGALKELYGDIVFQSEIPGGFKNFSSAVCDNGKTSLHYLFGVKG